LTVTTSLGNEGLDFVDKQDLYIADDSETFASCVIQGLTEAKTSILIENSKNTLKQKYAFKNLLNDVKLVAQRLNQNNT
jgi:hypothetical protein